MQQHACCKYLTRCRQANSLWSCAGILLDVNGMKALKAADTRLFTQFQQEVTDVSVQQAGTWVVLVCQSVEMPGHAVQSKSVSS